jgi:hypothetical protein
VGVPSSISSSSARAPTGRWGLTWVSAVILLVVALAGWKVYWTSQGFGVSVPNDLASWASMRTHLRSDATVFVGTSRIQAAMNPAVWAQAAGETPLQLALVGSTPLPVLEHLAKETDFRGLAIVGIVEMYMFNVVTGKLRGARAIAEYRALMTSPSRRAGVMLDDVLPQQALMQNTKLDFPGVLEAMWERHPVENPPANMQKNRWMEIEGDRLQPDDYDYTEFETMGAPASAAQRDSIIAEFESYIAQIQSRGGRVVLVAFPACGKRREIEARRYPREMYWEPLVAATSAILVVNSYDVPDLARFECADGSHLDRTDAVRFTQVLARMTATLQ